MKRTIRTSFLIAAAAIVGIEFGCSNSVSPNKDVSDLNLSQTEKAVISASGSFAFGLFGKMAEQAQGRNFFMSPLSVSMALAMTINGASGRTYTDMQTTLGLSGLSVDEINQSYRNIRSLFANLDPNVRFTIANSIWYRNTFSIAGSFVNVNKEYFDAEVRPLNFDDPGAVDIVNSWINLKTNEKIPKVLDPPIDPGVMMYLINALYFNGTWKYQFDQSATKPLPFYLADGTEKDVPTMTVHDTLKYYGDNNVSVVELPYGNGDYSMWILLPSAASSLSDLTTNLTSVVYQTIMDGLRDRDVQVQLPKFKITYDTLLNDPLKSLGMGIAFDPNLADFSRMEEGVSQGRLYISRVIHSTYIDVNEIGTEAAAVTVVEVFRTSDQVGGGGPIFFKANRPFVFLIKENHANTIMFMGVVADPGV